MCSNGLWYSLHQRYLQRGGRTRRSLSQKVWSHWQSNSEPPLSIELKPGPGVGHMLVPLQVTVTCIVQPGPKSPLPTVVASYNYDAHCSGSAPT